MKTVPVTTPGTDVPNRPDGTSWPHAMIFTEGDRMHMALADTAGELLSLLIDDYPQHAEADEDLVELDAIRIDYGLRLAQGVQESWLASATQEGNLDLSKTEPHAVDAWFRSKTMGVDVGEWTQQVPLLCLDMAYAPFTSVPAPTGNVAWVRVRDEVSLLRSMSQLGLISWFIPEPALA